PAPPPPRASGRRRPPHGRGAVGRTRRRRALLLPFELLLPHLDLVARTGSGRTENRLELVLRRRRTRDTEAAVRAVDAKRPPRRPRPVDEEVHHLSGGFGR